MHLLLKHAFANHRPHTRLCVNGQRQITGAPCLGESRQEDSSRQNGPSAPALKEGRSQGHGPVSCRNVSVLYPSQSENVSVSPALPEPQYCSVNGKHMASRLRQHRSARHSQGSFLGSFLGYVGGRGLRAASDPELQSTADQ